MRPGESPAPRACGSNGSQWLLLPQVTGHDPGEQVPLFDLAICRGCGDGLGTMGDKSPKATNKQAAQKQAKANTNTQKKSNAAAAKQAVKPKK